VAGVYRGFCELPAPGWIKTAKPAIICRGHVSSATAAAQELSYNYVQGAYGSVDLDDSSFSSDGDGLGIGGSMIINENFHITGEYQTADMDFGVDLNLLEVNLGYHTTVSENLDFVAQVGYLDLEVDAAGPISADDDAFLIGGGVRGRRACSDEREQRNLWWAGLRRLRSGRRRDAGKCRLPDRSD
jgi:hypothetical protein